MSKLRVWHNPQVGRCTNFYVPVESVEEGKKVMDILGAYDMFQFQRNIKPDYCNTNGLQLFDEEEQDWVDWDMETEDDYFDDVDDYLDGNEAVEQFSRDIFAQVMEDE